MIVSSTIWMALILFVIGETGRSRAHARTFFAGAFVCAMHFAAAMHWHYGWSHSAAWNETAAATDRVFGVAWGWGYLVNYLFLAAWLGDATGRLRRPGAGRGHRATWALRAFYALIIVNATVIFVDGWARAAGVVVSVTLAYLWTRR